MYSTNSYEDINISVIKKNLLYLKPLTENFFTIEVCKILFEQLGWNHSPI